METIEIVKLSMGSAGLIGMVAIIFKAGKFTAKMEARFDLIDERFEQIDKRFEQIDNRFDSISIEFDKVHNKIDSVEKNVQEVQDGLGALKVQFARMEGRTESSQHFYARRYHRVKK